MKIFETISKWDIIKYNWKYANIILVSGERVDWWKIFVSERWEVNYVSHNPSADWWGENLPPFNFSYILYSPNEDNECMNNESFLSIEIH